MLYRITGTPDSTKIQYIMKIMMILILERNVDRLCLFMNLRQVKEIEKHEENPGEREEYPRQFVNPHSNLVVSFDLFFLFSPLFISVFLL